MGHAVLGILHGELAVALFALLVDARRSHEGPVVLMLHGFPDTLHSWQGQLDAFAAAGYRAVAVAMRGYEPGSQPADGDFALEALAGDVSAWIDQLGAGQVHLVGHDWGAAIAGVASALAPGCLPSCSIDTWVRP